MAKPKRDDSVDNIFNGPMKLRHWAVTLIGYLGDNRTNTLPNTVKVDELIGQFVKDYNFYYNKMREEEE
tara:strand:+ start:242 stop:448 length:207 start_codon:yes stop_codon:yes gene_type:complete